MKSLLTQFGLLSALMMWMAGMTFAGESNRISADDGRQEIQQETTQGFMLDLGDLSDQSADEINQTVFDFIETHLSALPAELNCKVSVTGKVTVGVASLNITVEVSGPCSKV